MKALFVLLIVLLASPVVVQPITRNVQFVYVTYKENHTHPWADLRGRSAVLTKALNDFYGPQSFGKLVFTSTTFGYFDTDVSVTVGCDMTAVQAEVNPHVPARQSGEIRAWIFANGRNCNATGSPAAVYVRDPGTIFFHEFGHALGLPHAYALHRSSAGNWSEEYGDPPDVMSLKSDGPFKADSKLRLGWFDAEHRFETITSSQVVRLSAYESQKPGLKAVKVGALTLEYRALMGQSVLIHQGALLDLDQTTTNDDWSLSLGQTTVEMFNGVPYAFTTLAITAEYADVEIAIGGVPFHTSPSSVTWTPSVVAQTPVPGTATWTQTRTAEMTSYRMTVDGQRDVDLGLPATNSASLSLSIGTHSLVVKTCYGARLCLPSTPKTVVVADPNIPAFTPVDLGCWKDTATRALPLRLANAATVDDALALCVASSKKFCGLQYPPARQVWAGDGDYTKYGPVAGTCPAFGGPYVSHVFQVKP